MAARLSDKGGKPSFGLRRLLDMEKESAEPLHMLTRADKLSHDRHFQNGCRTPGNHSGSVGHVSYLALSNQGWEQIANFLMCGSLCIAFAVGLRRIWLAGRGSVWGPLLIGLFGLGLLIAGVFVIDPGEGYPPGAPTSGSSLQTWH